MKRRNFIKLLGGSALATSAIAGLPTILKAQSETEFLFDNSYEKDTSNSHFAIKINPSIFTNFSSVSEPLRTVTLRHSQSFDTEFEQKIEFSLDELETDVDENGNVYYIAELGKGLVTAGSKEFLPSNLPYKKGKLVYNPTSKFIKLLDKKENTILTLKKYEAPVGTDYDGDCYSSVALVAVLGLADHSYPMEMLRLLRHSFVASSELGIEKLSAYRQLSSELISNLNQVANQDEIYTYTAKHVIEPTIALIENNQMVEAMNLYGDYLIQLNQLIA